MRRMEECAVCAWRKDCKIKFKYEGGGLNCPEFSKDVSLFPKEMEDMEREAKQRAKEKLKK
jgi:hypothetical protein